MSNLPIWFPEFGKSITTASGLSANKYTVGVQEIGANSREVMGDSTKPDGETSMVKVN